MRSYRLLTQALSPLMPLWLHARALRGKEDRARLRERFGHTGLRRPKGTLLWLHAASVGEANSVLMLISKVRERAPQVHILLTTGTVSSARLMASRLPQGVIHQYVPVDTPGATRRFMRHWHPDFAFWVESELWPNLVAAADYYECFMGIINARMSERSFQGWQKHPAIIQDMLQRFNLIFAQSEADTRRLQALGARDVLMHGNLKYDAATLPCNEQHLFALRDQVGERPLWLAASTHPGEEQQVAQAHALLSATRPSLLLVIVPRHANRGAALAEQLAPFGKVALRARGDAVMPDTRIYIADTMGELGLFYRLCDIVFMGGSLVPHGGQNPLEPARLSCAIATGPHTHNFESMYAEMEQERVALRVHDAASLAATLNQLLSDPALRSRQQAAVKKWVDGKAGTADRLMVYLGPLLAPRTHKA